MRDGFYAVNRLSGNACLPVNDTPGGAVRMLLLAFVTQDTAMLAAVLADDYRFRATQVDFRARFPAGLNRAAQLDSVTRLASISHKDPRSASLMLLGVFPDTIVGQGPLQGAVARRRVTLDAIGLRRESDVEAQVLVGPTPCVFEVVRGDSARVPPGQPRDRSRWYVTAWFVGTGEGAPASDSIEGAGHALETPISRLQLGIRRVSPLPEWPITLEITLPAPAAAQVELFDAAGRRHLSRRLAGRIPGSHRLEMDAPGLSAGVYWIRVSQGDRRATAKFVILH